jgi:hypothetical protein
VAELAMCRVSGDLVSLAPAGVCRGVHNVLRVRIWCAITLISSLCVAVLQPRAASLNPLGDLAYCGLRDPVQGLHGG